MHALLSPKIIVLLALFQESMGNPLEVRFVLDTSVNGRKFSIDTVEGKLGQSHRSFCCNG